MIQGDSDYAAHERTFLAWLRTGIAVVVRSLGNLNDLETIAPFLARVLPHVRAANRRDFDAAQHFCRGWSGATAATLRQNAESAMKRFEKIPLMKP
jgi:uncharacterized membrane protein YidH (DUF202 family)